MSGTPREPRASPPGIPRRGRIPSRCAAVITATLAIAGLLAFAASAPASATVLPPAWSQATPAHHPSAGPAISAFDPATGHLVLYGTDRFATVAWTWAWDGSDWIQLSPAHMPYPRVGSSLAFDPLSGKLLLFGGQDPLALSNFYSDTWAWDGSDWTKLSPVHSPHGRSGGSMAFDPRAGRMLLFGGDAGFDDGGQLSDAWRWDGSDWSQLTPPSHPSFVEGTVAPMAYDAATSQMVLFASGQTWLWSGSVWNAVVTAHTPSCSSRGAAAFDPAAGGVVLVCANVWMWNGSDWIQSSGTIPTSRTGAAMDFDRSTGQLVVFGGDGGLTDTWLDAQPANSPAWTNALPVSSPPASADPAMAYDDATHQLLMFGGATPDPLADTWRWTGEGWVQLAPATVPPARSGAAMVFDPVTGMLVMFGGEGDSGPLGDTWLWNGKNWLHATPGTSAPSRAGASMAFDPATGNVVLVGGAGATGLRKDTWTWDGANWSKASPPASPPKRRDAAVVFDESIGRLVLFGGLGGSGALADTWTWDGSTWTPAAPAHAPPARSDAAAAFDPVLGRAVLFGGMSKKGSTLGDTWAWTGSDWSNLSPTKSPPARSGAGAALDPRSGDVVLFGGQGATSLRSDTWIGPVKDAAIVPEVTAATAPNTLSGAFSMSFNRPVHGVDTSDLTVTEVGPLPVSGAVSCLDASAAPVSCSSGPVTTALFQPAKPLIAGEYYFFDVNQSSTAVRDQYDNPVPFTPVYLRAQTAFTGSEYPLKYSWGVVSDGSALGGSYVQERLAGASERFKFTGTSLNVVAWGGPDGGRATVSITSTGAPTITQQIDTYAASAGDVTFPFPSLVAGSHTATITVKGTKNGSSTDTFVRIDAFDVDGVTTTTPAMTATWASLGSGSSSYVTSGQTRASVTLHYRGTSVVWRALAGPNAGKAKVNLDGTAVGTFDLYARSSGYVDITLTHAGIPDTFHDLAIVVLGSKRGASADTLVTLRQLTLS